MKHRIAIVLATLTVAGAVAPVAQAGQPDSSLAQPARSSWSGAV